VEDNLALPQGSAKQLAVANGQKHVSTHLLEVNVGLHV
jgi:hypothetical protein